MKKVFLNLSFILIIFTSTSLNAQIFDELPGVSDKSDIFMYVNVEKIISFFKNKGINIKELDDLFTGNTAKENDEKLPDFGIKLSDINEILFAGCIEDLEKKRGFLFFIKINSYNVKIPEHTKTKPVKINGITFYEVQGEKETSILFALSGNIFIAGPKEYIEAYYNKKNSKNRNLSEAIKQFRINAADKALYINLSVSDYLKNEMEKAYTQGILVAKGLGENVFLKTLLNLKFFDYGIQITDRIHLFAGMQGASEVDSERLLMLSHFAIVGTSFAASFADLIAARSRDNTLGKVTENNEILVSLQQIFGRMKAKQVNNGVVVSFFLTENETDSFIAFVKKSIVEEKKARAERIESEKISSITKAISEKDTVKAEMLMKEKIDVNRKDLDGNYILSIAAYMGDMKILSRALSMGAFIEMKNSEGLTPLHFAAKGGSLEAVKYLISKGADVFAKTENDMTALHYNSQQGNPDITTVLLQSGVDVNSPAMDGATPSHLASEEGYIDIIKILSEKGADFTIRDANGERAVEVAARNGHTVLVDFFKTKYNLEPSPISEEETDSDYNDEFTDEFD